MNYKIKKNLENFIVESYVKESQEDLEMPQDLIDCSLGINPFGSSVYFDEFKADFANNFSINNYPDFPYISLKREIADYWKDFCSLEESNIRLGTGSIGILLSINRLFIGKDSAVLGSCPTFTPYVSDVRLNEGIFDHVPLKSEDNYRFDYEAFLEKISSNYTLIYIDNPNNPTGQVIPLPVLKAIVEKAREYDVVVVIDEAYGDFIDSSNSAMGLVNRYDNLIVVRSFSKGFGLAGLRIGYLAANKAICNLYSKVDVPFTINNAGQYAAICAMRDRAFIQDSRKKIGEIKSKILSSFKKMKVLETNSEVPIMTIRHPDNGMDLFQKFKTHHVLTEAGSDFTGLGANFVRMRIPKDRDRITGIIEEIEKKIL